MGKCIITYTELRFVIEPELTHCYVAVTMEGDCPLGVEGWHHQSFPASVNTLQILELIRDGKETPVLWAQRAPDA